MLTRIELSRGNALHNVRQFRELLHPDVAIACVVKGNAYGHGLEEMVRILEDEVDYFQVDDLAELRRLRQWSGKPCLVLGYVATSELSEAVELGCELAVYDLGRLEILQRMPRRARVHLKLDIYLGRQGVLERDLDAFLQRAREFDNVEFVAAYTHFANIEDTGDRAHARAQIDGFRRAMRQIEVAGLTLRTHLSSTSGALAYERELGQNAIVRIGLGTYGMWPSEMLRAQNENLQLRPVMRWVTHVAQVKLMPPKYPIGYGLTYRTAGETRVAIIPQGYSDGYLRALSNRGSVLIRGTRCRVLGRVAMNMFAVDVSHLPDLRAEEEVVLLGAQGDDEISAEQLAEQIGTINYEVTTLVSPLLPRIVTE